MALEMLVGGLVAAVVVLGLVGRLLPKRRPPSPVFRCDRCGAASRHNDRTTDAWRRGKTKFFCKGCHARWLQSRPPQVQASSAGSATGGGSGCLGVAALFALLPLAALLAWARA